MPTLQPKYPQQETTQMDSGLLEIFFMGLMYLRV